MKQLSGNLTNKNYNFIEIAKLYKSRRKDKLKAFYFNEEYRYYKLEKVFTSLYGAGELIFVYLNNLPWALFYHYVRDGVNYLVYAGCCGLGYAADEKTFWQTIEKLLDGKKVDGYHYMQLECTTSPHKGKIWNDSKYLYTMLVGGEISDQFMDVLDWITITLYSSMNPSLVWTNVGKLLDVKYRPVIDLFPVKVITEDEVKKMYTEVIVDNSVEIKITESKSLGSVDKTNVNGLAQTLPTASKGFGRFMNVKPSGALPLNGSKLFNILMELRKESIKIFKELLIKNVDIIPSNIVAPSELTGSQIYSFLAKADFDPDKTKLSIINFYKDKLGLK